MGRDWTDGGSVGSSEEPDQLFTYEDIENYQRVLLRGEEGYVIEKGKGVSGRAGKHMKVELVNGRTTTLKDSVVNRYLREKKYLWVDWGWRLCQEAYKTNAS